MEPEAAAPGDTFVTNGRVRLAEAVRHLVDATLTAEDASSEQLASAAKKVERIATELHGRGSWAPARRACVPAGRSRTTTTSRGARSSAS